MAIQPGLYEQLITQALKQELDKLDRGLKSITTRVDSEESHGILARYMERYLSCVLARVKGRDKLVKQIAVCNELISLACNSIEKDQEGHGHIDLEGRRLLQVLDPALANSPRPEKRFWCGLCGVVQYLKSCIDRWSGVECKTVPAGIRPSPGHGNRMTRVQPCFLTYSLIRSRNASLKN